jgi:hypothetical protein
MSESLWNIIFMNAMQFSEHNVLHYTQVITAECNVTIWYRYLHLYVPQCDPLINKEMKMLLDKICL